MNSALMLHRHAGPAVAGSYTLGAVAGSITTAAGLLIVGGLVSPMPQPWRGVLAILGLALLVLRALGLVCFGLPQRKYQIPRETFNGSPRRAAFRFAFELGAGVRTYVTTEAPYGLVLLLVLCPADSLWGATLAGAATAVGFGLGRARIVAAQAWRRSVAVDHPESWLRAASFVSLGLSLVAASAHLAGS